MNSSDNVSTTFVNTVIGRGSLNGVINLSFSTFNFTPNDQGQVDIDPVISCRLRMDKVCATQLRDVMNELLAAIEKAEQDVAVGIPAESQSEGIMPKKAAEKMN
jgi:hypothetical protein